MKSKMIYYVIILFIFTLGCSSKKQPAEPVISLAIDDISDSSYRMIAKKDANSLTLLGHLQFDEIKNDEISGSWNLETWGENSLFPMLPLNNGNEFPASAGTGKFSGFMFGNEVIIQIDLPSSENTLGIIIEGLLDDKLVGRITLLPDKKFDGRFEAIKIQN